MDDLGYLKHMVLEELSNFKNEGANMFIEWIKSDQLESDLQNYKAQKKPVSFLKKIAKDIKKILPLKGALPTETILQPSLGSNSDINIVYTTHIDEFIYNDSEVEKLQSDGTIDKFYCSNCNSKDIKETVLISHSLDSKKVGYVCTVLLPSNLKTSTLLDVGSRIGAVLYGAYYWTTCNNIIGVEINKELCDIQNKMLEKYDMVDRIKIINSDIMLARQEVSQSDIVILHNVFEFFMQVDLQKAAWEFMKSNLKQGCYLVTVPSVEESLDALGIYDDFSDWLERLGPHRPENMINFDMTDTQFGEIYFYRVK